MQKMTLTAPAIVDDTMDDCSTHAAEMVAKHTSGKTALAGLGYGGTMPESNSGASPYTLPVKMIAITPTDEGICTRRGEYGYVTSAQILEALSDKFSEMRMPDSQSAILVIIGGVDETDLATALAMFNEAWPITELERVQRRMGNLANLERDKMVITEAGAYPHARAGEAIRHLVGLSTSQFMGRWVGIDEEMDRLGVDISARLADFSARHSAKKNDAQSRVEALQAAITGDHDGFFVHATTGTPTALANEFGALPAPLAEAYKCTVGVCFYGEAENMTYLSQLFGVSA